MKLFDLHCDTALSLWRKDQPLAKNDLHISLEKADYLEKYIQTTAIFTRKAYTNEEGWQNFWKIRENLEKECEKNSVPLLKNADELKSFDTCDKKTAFILAVEDVRLIDGKISRIKELYDAGVRVITLLWGGETIIGGSHNTDIGLTSFGREALEAMIEFGIIPDISHASSKSVDDILDICEKNGVSPIATHMNSFSLCPHSRNLTDDRYKRLIRLGGIVGMSLCPKHLSSVPSDACADSAADHIIHYHNICPDVVSLGCDLDGTPLPDDIADISQLPRISESLKAKGMTENHIESVFYNSAYKFMSKNLPLNK